MHGDRDLGLRPQGVIHQQEIIGRPNNRRRCKSTASRPGAGLWDTTAPYATPYGAFDCQHNQHEPSMNNPVRIFKFGS
jgi:hypothetical protein